MPEAPHMPDNKSILRDLKLKPHFITNLFPIGKSRRINGIRHRMNQSRPCHLLPKDRLSGQFGTGQAKIRLFPQIPAQKTGYPSLHSRIHAGASCMGYRKRHTRLFGNRQIDGCRARHMAMHSPVSRMLPEKILPGLPVRHPVHHPESGHTIHMAAQPPYLLVKKTPLFRMDTEIKLYFIPVHMTVAVHNPAFRPSQVGSSQNLKHSYRFLHRPFPPFPWRSPISFTKIRFALACRYSARFPANPRLSPGISINSL